MIAERVREVAETFQLAHLLDRKPKALSGGQRQRVAMSRALVQTPKVFLFDEPLSNLDAKLRISMRVEIGRPHRKLRATSIYVTHDQVEALTMADRIAVMNGGRVEQIGNPLTLYHRPAMLFVAGFIGSPRINFLSGNLLEIGAGFARVALDAGPTWTVRTDASAARPGAKVTLGIRPEHLHLVHAAGSSEADISGINRIPGVLEVAERLGEQTYLHLTVPEMRELLVVKVPGTPQVQEGRSLTAACRPEDGHLLSEEGTAFTRLVMDDEATSAAIPASQDEAEVPASLAPSRIIAP